MSFSDFCGRRILVTGDTGFKGAWLSTWLHHLGADVYGLALPPALDAPLYEKLQLSERIAHTDCDIRDLQQVRGVLTRVEPDVVLHLAAQSLVLRGYEDPQETFATNVVGTVNVMEAVRQTPSVRSLIVVTTDKCYRNPEHGHGFVETDELGGDEPYGASKAAAEIAFNAYNQSFFTQRVAFTACSARAGNVIGGGDFSENRLLPDCVRAFKDGVPVMLRRPEAVRPWQHVLDPLSGYMRLVISHLSADVPAGGAWNFGPDEEGMRTVQALAETAASYWPESEVIVSRNQSSPYEATLLYLDSNKAKTELGWRPVWGFETAVEKAIDWYRRIDAGEDAYRVAVEHIDAYMGDF